MKIGGLTIQSFSEWLGLLIFFKFFYTTKYIHSIMSNLTVDVLKEICNRVPEGYVVEFVTADGVTYHLSDNVGVDISAGKLILKS